MQQITYVFNIKDDSASLHSPFSTVEYGKLQEEKEGSKFNEVKFNKKKKNLNFNGTSLTSTIKFTLNLNEQTETNLNFSSPKAP